MDPRTEVFPLYAWVINGALFDIGRLLLYALLKLQMRRGNGK